MRSDVKLVEQIFNSANVSVWYEVNKMADNEGLLL